MEERSLFSETGFVPSYQFQKKNGNYFTGIKSMIWFDDLQCRFLVACQLGIGQMEILD